MLGTRSHGRSEVGSSPPHRRTRGGYVPSLAAACCARGRYIWLRVGEPRCRCGSCDPPPPPPSFLPAAPQPEYVHKSDRKKKPARDPESRLLSPISVSIDALVRHKRQARVLPSARLDTQGGGEDGAVQRLAVVSLKSA